MSELLRRPPPGPIVFSVDMRVRLDDVPDFRGELDRALRRVREEPSCVTVRAYASRDEPGRFRLYEHWSDGRHFYDEVRSRPYFQHYKAATSRMHLTSPVLDVWVPCDDPEKGQP